MRRRARTESSRSKVGVRNGKETRLLGMSDISVPPMPILRPSNFRVSTLKKPEFVGTLSSCLKHFCIKLANFTHVKFLM